MGYKEEEIIGKNWFDHFIPERDRNSVKAVFEKLVAAEIEPAEYFENSLLTRNGVEKIIAWHNTFIKDVGGNIVGTLSSGEDITERKRAEEALQESEKRYRTLAEAAPDMIFIVDGEGYVKYVNSFAAKQLRNRPEEIIGKSIQDLFPSDISSRQRQHLQKVFEGGKPMYFENKTTFLDRDVWLGTWLAPLLNEAGEVYSVLGISRDITEQRQVGEALRESENRFRLLVEHSADTFFLHDSDGRIIDVNRHACLNLGYTREELLGLSVWDIDQNFTPGKHKEKWTQMVPGMPIIFEGVHKRKDGTAFPVEVHLGAFELGGRKLMLGLVRNITERKRMEEEREKLIHELQDALANVRTLRGLLPICSYCKKIRDDKGYWNQIESYIRDHSGAEFSHGMCPECLKKLYPDLADS